MRFFLQVCVIFCVAGRLSAQSQLESPPISVKFPKDSVSKFLLISNDPFTEGADSVAITLHKTISAVDSIRLLFEIRASQLSHLKSRLEYEVDSLRKLGNTFSQIESKVDSTKARLETLKQNFIARIDSCRSAAIGKLSKMRLPPELEVQRLKALGTVQSKVDGVAPMLKLSSDKIPDLNLGTPLSLIGNVSVPQTSIANANVPGLTMPGVPTNVVTLPDVSEDAIQENVEHKISELIDKKSIDSQLEAMPAPADFSEDALKEQVIYRVRTQAVNHFAGHEKEIDEAMQQLSKYKKEYENVLNTAKILKLKKNDMKGKPFFDRVRLGTMVQFSNRNGDWSVDLNTYVGYRITERLSAGPGWNQRIAYTVDSRQFNPNAAIYGPRAFAEFEAWKGFCPRIEGEVMKTHKDFSKIVQPIDPNYNNWVWGAFVGLKKVYNIAGRLRGSACIMTRLFNHDRQSPYPSPLSIRAGFEFSLNGLKKNNDEALSSQD